jgi:hypothetical protein
MHHCGSCTSACPVSLDVEAMANGGTMENAESILRGSCVGDDPLRVQLLYGAVRLTLRRRLEADRPREGPPADGPPAARPRGCDQASARPAPP